MHLIGIALAIWISRQRRQAASGDPSVVTDVALWGVPAGIIGGRVSFDLTTLAGTPHAWCGVLAVWSGGPGHLARVAAGAVAGIWRVRLAGVGAARSPTSARCTARCGSRTGRRSWPG